MTERKKKEVLQAIEHLVSRVPTGASLGSLLRLVPQMSEALSTTAKQWQEMLEGIKHFVLQGPTLDSSTLSVLDLMDQAPCSDLQSEAVSQFKDAVVAISWKKLIAWAV